MTNIEYANSLRQIADFYEANPDMPVPGWPSEFIFLYDRQAFLNAVKVLARGGKVTKEVERREDGNYKAIRDFGGNRVIVEIPRKAICRLIRPAEYDCPDSLLEEAAEYSEVA